MKDEAKKRDRFLWIWPVILAVWFGLSAAFSPTPATAAGPSDAEAVVRALDRISTRLEKLDDDLRDAGKECRR